MPVQPVITSIHHVSLLAQDLERTVRFYVEMLGLQTIDHIPAAVPAAVDGAWLGDRRRGFIALTRASEGQPGQLGVGTIHHVGLAVSSLDALLKWKRWLQDHDVLVYGPYDQRAYQDLVFEDPDGVLLEIATDGPGWAGTQDGEEVYSPPLETMAPFRDEERIQMHTWPHPVNMIEPDMAIQGLHHVAAITSSLTKTDAFYRDVVGLPLVRKMVDSDDPEVERWYWGLDGGRPGTLVAAFPITHVRKGGKAASGRVGTGVALHYALGTASRTALQSWVTAASAAGSEVMSGTAEAGNEARCVRDPDGLVVELVTADPGAGMEGQ